MTCYYNNNYYNNYNNKKMDAQGLINQVMKEDKKRKAMIYNQPKSFWVKLNKKMKLNLLTAKYE